MVSITAAMPETGFELASAEQLHSLMSIVLAAQPELKQIAARQRDFAEQFQSAFYRIGFMFRLDGPSHRRYCISFVDEASEWLSEKGLSKVSAPAFFAACLAHADIPWQAADGSIGALLSVGLDPYSGRRCNNAWRDLLSGNRGLLAPSAPQINGLRIPQRGTARTYEEDARTGEMRLVGFSESIRSRG